LATEPDIAVTASESEVEIAPDTEVSPDSVPDDAPVPPTDDTPVSTTSVTQGGPRERHFSILYGETGHSYESLLMPYLDNAREVIVEDPYIRLTHQVQNFVRFCEAVIKHSTVKRIKLVTSYDEDTPLDEVQERLGELKQSLLEIDVVLEVELNPNLHDREIRIDNGWIIKIGRGLDFYQRPTSWFGVGANDMSLRACLETKVDIYRR